MLNCARYYKLVDLLGGITLSFRNASIADLKKNENLAEIFVTGNYFLVEGTVTRKKTLVPLAGLPLTNAEREPSSQ